MKKSMMLLAVVTCFTMQAVAWGFYGHKLLNFHAVFLLPPEMMVLYKPHIGYLVEHSVDPDKRRYVVAEEGPRHYLDMDRYGKDAFASFTMTWDQACSKYTEDSLKAHGIVPWWIQTMLSRLTKAFRDQDLTPILKLSAEIGHYVGDAHVPLHASSNHNGQYTGQHGIHGFWESRIPELLAEKDWDFWVGSADFIRKPLVYIWKRVHESSAAADSVLFLERQLNDRFPSSAKYAFEERNGVVVKQYSEAYTRAYDKLLNGMVEHRFRQAVHSVASFWYTAWINAGQPDCAKIVAKAFEGEDETAMRELEQQWRNGKPAGRSCD